MRSPRLIALLVAVLLPLSVLAALSPTADAARPVSAPVAAAKAKPSQDFPHLPRKCASRTERIPARPLICKLNSFDAKRPTIVMWGDSHSWMFIPAVLKAVKGRGINVVASMMGSCPPMDTNYKRGTKAPACIESNDLGLRYVLKLARGKQPVRVVLGASWQRYLHALKVHDITSYVGQMGKYFRKGAPRLMKTLGSAGVGTDVIGQVATVPAKHARCSKGQTPYACDLPRAKSLPEYGSTRRYVARIMKPLPGGDKQISVNDYFCSSQVCHGRVQNEFTWFDDFHLSATMSRHQAFAFNRTVAKVTPGTGGGGDDPNPPFCPLPILCKSS